MFVPVLVLVPGRDCVDCFGQQQQLEPAPRCASTGNQKWVKWVVRGWANFIPDVCALGVAAASGGRVGEGAKGQTGERFGATWQWFYGDVRDNDDGSNMVTEVPQYLKRSVCFGMTLCYLF